MFRDQWYDAPMTTTRPRRIIKRAVIVLAVVVLLVVWYIGMWIAIPWATLRYEIPKYRVWHAIEPAFAPIDSYCRSGLPGGESLSRWRTKQLMRAFELRKEHPPSR